MKPLDKLFWLRGVSGLLAGVILGVTSPILKIDLPEALLVAFLMYMVSYYLARAKIYSKIPPGEARKIATAGLGSFITLLLFTWILINTLLTAGQV